MLLVVADTGPIHYLVEIGHIGILPQLFETASMRTNSGLILSAFIGVHRRLYRLLQTR